MRTAVVLAATLVAALSAPVRAATTDTAKVSLAAQAAPPGRLSGGLALAIEAAQAAVPPAAAVRAGVADQSKGQPGVTLDARVGPNVRLGDDPAVLPLNQSGQAEPHLYRSVANPDVLLATFQEGRFNDAGSLDCGYAVSHDGGLTWTRALIPQLTTASGGAYNRATDPVAAIGPDGGMYLNTLASISGAFSTAAVVVSRSTDGGSTWGAPAVVYQSTSTLVMPDKNWMAVNDYAGVPNSGRLAVTWTSFTSNASGQATGSNLVAAVSDDHGATWSTPVAITPAGSVNQGTQPVFLPDGTLVVVYVRFTSNSTNTQFAIDCKHSLDGGRTFPATANPVVANVNGWDDPDLRDGVFLPSATVARASGALFVTYTAVVNGTPRVLVTKSTDAGLTWSPPVIASDNPAGASVVDPAVAVTPDGSSVAVVFQDKRNATDGHNFIDTYAAQSFDGGTTWQPNLRLTNLTSDIRNATATTRGYFLGDYLAVAPSLAPDEPAVAIWCDARTGDADPYTARFTQAASPSFAAWEVARFTPGELANPAVTGGLSDPDEDGRCNYAEFFHQTDPRVPEPGTLFATDTTASDVRLSFRYRLGLDPAATVRWEHSFDGVNWTTASFTSLPNDFPQPNDNAGTVIFPHTPGTPELFREVFADASGGPGAPVEVVPVNTDARLINVSTRANAGTGAAQLIAGFVISGSKAMLVRAAGPALTAFAILNPLPDPTLTLSSPTGAISTVLTNAGWQQGDATGALFDRLGAFPFSPGSHDAAVVQTLPSGNYSAQVSSATNQTGPVLVEAYDASTTPGAPGGPRILNLSTRAKVAADGSNTLIAGFVISGSLPRRVLIRAVGPSLAGFGVTNPIADPMLTLYRQDGTVLAANDDWQESANPGAVSGTANRIGAFPLQAPSLDACLLLTLPPGLYSATVTGVSGAGGVALVEVYDAD